MKTWIPLALSLTCVLTVRLFIFQDVAQRQTWKTDLYLGADGTSFVWQAIQYRNHGLFSHGDPKSELYGLYEEDEDDDAWL